MNTWQTARFLTFVAPLIVVSAPSQLTAAAPTAEPIREAGDIRGAVTFCGQPAQDAVVYIRGTSYNAITDANGGFRLSYVQQGVYDLVVKKDGVTRGAISQVAVNAKQLSDAGTTDLCVDLDGDGFSPPADCNDSNPNIHPGAPESCGDGVDNNCDGAIDEGCQACTDNDGDGFYGQAGCGGALDCNDNDAAINPQAMELCDGIDNNCDGTVDETGAVGETTFYRDADGDGYGSSGDTVQACGAPAGYAAVGGDCDDANAGVNPGASEQCDAIDNDCDGTVDGGLDQAIANGFLACTGGNYAVSCQAGFADCNAFSGDGCEIDLNSDLGNCGQCGNICDDGNSETVEMCVSGSCTSL